MQPTMTNPPAYMFPTGYPPRKRGEQHEDTFVPELYRYGNILGMERPRHDGDVFSRKHPRMPLLQRAKIFAPFAALDGFDDRVRRKEAVYVSKYELDADQEWALNQRLYRLHQLTANSRLVRANPVKVKVEYFYPCTDPESDAYGEKGSYRTVIGTVQKVDREQQTLSLIVDGAPRVLPFEDIYQIQEPPNS